MFGSICKAIAKVPLGSSAIKSAAPFVPDCRHFHSTKISLGLEEFIEIKKSASDSVTNGRAWTPADLRKKSFEDLHKLWYVLYKERNLLLTEREKMRRNSKPINAPEENRYRNVKRSMACIKFVINERKTIEKLIEKENSESKTEEA